MQWYSPSSTFHTVCGKADPGFTNCLGTVLGGVCGGVHQHCCSYGEGSVSAAFRKSLGSKFVSETFWQIMHCRTIRVPLGRLQDGQTGKLYSLSHVKGWSHASCSHFCLLSGEHRSSHQLLVITFDPQPVAKLLDKHIFQDAEHSQRKALWILVPFFPKAVVSHSERIS